ncbi:MAG: hypothetical protein LBR25_03710 [Erysipelotrichaceae bacterium]|jgi:hypothetical protein|nr:hypothetical protein [Erysipelotrichaceae bacterium]
MYTNSSDIFQLNDWERLEQVGAVPVEFGVLKTLFSDYRAPTVKIADLCKKQLLLRLKKGLYIVSKRITHKPVPVFAAANHLHGPSYISFHTALAYKKITA